jgi:hypothetical protein
VEEQLIVRGRRIGPDDLDQIRGLIAQEGRRGRSHVSNQLCQAWDWRQANGQFRQIACRGLLLELEAKGLIELPPRLRGVRRPGYSNRIGTAQRIEQAPLDGSIGAIGHQITLERVQGRPQLQLFKDLVGNYHYLGYRQAPKASSKPTALPGGSPRRPSSPSGPSAARKVIPSTSMSHFRPSKSITASPMNCACARSIRRTEQLSVNTDETGHKENAVRYWIWCFRAARFVVFKISPSRGTEVLLEILGEKFKGILGCDYYAAYRKYARLCGVLVQFCLAHLIREVKYLCEFPDPQVQRYGKGLLAGLQALFHVLHRKEQLSEKAYQRELAAAQEQIWEAAMAPKVFPQRFGGAKMHRLITNLVRRFEKHGQAYFEFITHPEIDPTNNVAEQAMRFVVIDRHITQGTRSWRGGEICERIWTVMATCTLQKRSPFHWMCEAITAWFQGRPVPSLLEDSS